MSASPAPVAPPSSPPAGAPPDPAVRRSADVTREWTGSFAVLQELLRQEQAELARDVLLWQRWIRYAATAVFAVVAGLVQDVAGAPLHARLALLGIVAAYLAAVAIVGQVLERTVGKPVGRGLPGLVIALDLTAIGGCAFVALPPAQGHLVLLAGFLVLQLATFHFGRGLGLCAAGGTMAIYLLEARVVAPVLAGPPPGLPALVANLAIFAFVSGVQIGTFGSFRNRMDALRQFCKRVELGDLNAAYDTERDPRPDDLTLLARSVDAMRQRLIELVGTDPLTGTLNRRALETRLRREWRGVRRRGGMLAVLAVDLDNFKIINDSWGHPAGDTVLRQLADVMRATLRDTDVIARVGGDEFVLVLPDTDWPGATRVAERLRGRVSEMAFAGEHRIAATISIGVALAGGADDVKSTDLLEEADRSLYRAKAAGRNQVGS